MFFDEIDKKMLRENFDDETISKIDSENLVRIYNYLIKDGVYYAKDLIISSIDLFLLTEEEFIEKFENLKSTLGEDYIEKLGKDLSLLDMMYN